METVAGRRGLHSTWRLASRTFSRRLNLSAMCASPHVYDAQAAGDCMADIQLTLSSCGNTGVQVPVCASMCTGTAAPGASCAMNWDCASSDAGTAVCELAMGDTSATNSCKLEVHATVGDSCNQTCAASSDGNGTICTYLNAPSTSVDLECYVSDGLYCAPDAICRPLVGPGGSCTNQTACQAGYYCDLTSSTCVPNVAAGAACPRQVECSSNDYCDNNNTCAPKKVAGAACSGTIGECERGRCDTSTLVCVAGGALTVTAQSCANPSLSSLNTD